MKVIDFVLENHRDDYDYILIDSHPELSDLLRSIIYASDYCVSPVKLDRQSAIGVATVLGEIDNVNTDIEMLRRALAIEDDFHPTAFGGSMGMMAREYAEELKNTEMSEYNRLRRAGEIFDSYVTEGDGLRQAAAARCPVFDIIGANASKQSRQFKALAIEFMERCS
jgi:chromosome partitioning protein